MSILDEIIDLRRARLVHRQRHGFRLIQHDGGVDGKYCSTAAKYYSTAQNAPQDAAAIGFGNWFAPTANLHHHSSADNLGLLLTALRCMSR